MANYVFAYHGGGKMPETPEEGQKLMAKWKAWMEGMGEAMLNHGTPVGMSKAVSTEGVADNGGSNPLMGYSVVKADNMEAALEFAKACPHLEIGTIEVAEALEMEMQVHLKEMPYVNGD